MMSTNKEIIDRLQEYFLTQDAQIVARSLAGLMIDLNRMMIFSSLSNMERVNLMDRMEINRRSLIKFIEMGEGGDLVLFNIESEK